MKIELNVPNSLNEITLGQYQEYLKLGELSDIELSLKTVQIFCRLTYEQVRMIRANDVSKAVNIISKIFEAQPPLIHSFTLGGVKYGFINDLDEMTFGEYVDLDTYIGDWENIEKAMGVLYRPIEIDKGERYHLKEYSGEDTEHLKEMPLDVVLGSIVFFYNLGNDLCKVTMNSLEEEEVQNLLRMLNLENGGDGTQAFMHSLNQMLGDFKILLN